VGKGASWLLLPDGCKGLGQMPRFLPAHEPSLPRRGICGQRPAAPAAGGPQMGALPRLSGGAGDRHGDTVKQAC